MTEILFLAFVSLVALLGAALVIGMLYRRAERDAAFVRTGLGGKKVIKDGGAVVLPVFHSLAVVKLNTLLLTVNRGEKDALITKDRMRADIGAEFYVRVKPDVESIGLAAQTLGERTNDADELRKLIEAKLVDALRSVAATMTLIQLQEQRAAFVKAVQEAVAADLMSNGLELESVSLTRLDQTDKRHFNPDNTFDAEGLAALTKITETRRKEVNDITRATEVAIAERDRDAQRQKLEIAREVEEAELNQRRDIAQKTAATRAETASKEAEARRAEEEARIASEQAVAERAAKAKEARERAELDADRAIHQRRIEADRDVEIAEQERQILVALKSRDESEAKAQAEDARAKAVAAEERVGSAKQVEIAEREKRIAVIDAEKEAQIEATAVTVKADADKMAALDEAEAVRTRAQAKADAARIEAEGVRELGLAQAEAEAAMNEARGKLPAHVIEYELTRERIRIIPQALAEAVKPLENISDIRIFDTGGLAGRSDGGGAESFGDGLTGQLLRYRAQAPVLDEILRQAGFEGKDPIAAFTGGLAPQAKRPPAGADGAGAPIELANGGRGVASAAE